MLVKFSSHCIINTDMIESIFDKHRGVEIRMQSGDLHIFENETALTTYALIQSATAKETDV